MLCNKEVLYVCLSDSMLLLLLLLCVFGDISYLCMLIHAKTCLELSVLSFSCSCCNLHVSDCSSCELQ